MPRTATLRPLTADELSPLDVALDARIDALEQVTDEDRGDLVPMLRRLDRDIVNAWRPL